MKKSYWLVVVIVGLLGVWFIASFAGFGQKNKKVGSTPGDGGFVQLDTSTATATSTANNQPTLILSRNYNRLSADICSLKNNSTSTFIYFKNFASPAAASTTVVTNNGINIEPGNCYSIRGSNEYITDVWATSSVLGQIITATEK